MTEPLTSIVAQGLALALVLGLADLVWQNRAKIKNALRRRI